MQLKALIESKGETPPVGNKPVLLEKWNKLKDTPDWEQTVFFTSEDQLELEQLCKSEEEENSSNSEEE